MRTKTVLRLREAMSAAADRLAACRPQSAQAHWAMTARSAAGEEVELRGHPARVLAIALAAAHRGEVYFSRPSAALRSLISRGLMEAMPYGGFAPTAGVRPLKVSIC